MNLLAIETSGPVLSIAIRKSGSKPREVMIQGYMKHAENILPVIDRLLKKEKLEIGDIDAFLIGRGPGSFTGLRVGFATLKGFLSTCPKPCYGAFSLDLIAAGIQPLKNTGDLTVCLDAKRGKLYSRSYRRHEKKWLPNGSSRVVFIGEMARQVPEGSSIAGDGIRKIQTGNFKIIPEKSWFPRASTLIKLFEAHDPLLKKLTRPKELLPAYLRHSEPEEKLAEGRDHD